MGVGICILLTGIGFAIFVMGISMHWRERRFVEDTIPVSVEVTGFEENWDGEDRMFKPVFRVFDGEFAGRIWTSSYGSSEPI